ncbi:MAG: glycosyltransferase [Candidatus Diapherotrites archaeon]
MKIAVVLPAYNEKGNIGILARRLQTVFSHLRISYELIVVLDGEDGSKEELEALHDPNLRINYSKERRGVARALRIGFDAVPKNADYVLTMDADLNHQPEELSKFLAAIKQPGVDIVIGSRRVEGGKMQQTALKKFISWVANEVFGALFGLKVKDITSGYRLMKRKAVEDLKGRLVSTEYEIYPEFLIRAAQQKYGMVEVPIDFKIRVRGTSKMDMKSAGVKYAKLVFKVLFNQN